MFDVGFSEIFVIAIVALLVLGPERLPKAARFAGLWVRRARAQWYSVKSELENELADEELKRSLRQTQADLREARAALMAGGAALQRDFEDAASDVQNTLRDAAAGTDATGGAGAAAEGAANAAPEAAGESHDEYQGEYQGRMGSALHELEEPPPPADADDEEGDLSATP